MGENGQSFKQGSQALLGSDRRVNGSNAIGSLSTGSPVGSPGNSGGLNVQSGHGKHITSCEPCLCDQESNEKLSLGSTGGARAPGTVSSSGCAPAATAEETERHKRQQE